MGIPPTFRHSASNLKQNNIVIIIPSVQFINFNGKSESIQLIRNYLQSIWHAFEQKYYKNLFQLRFIKYEIVKCMNNQKISALN